MQEPTAVPTQPEADGSKKPQRLRKMREKPFLVGAMALTIALGVTFLIPRPAYASSFLGLFDDIPTMIKTWLLDITATTFNLYFGVVNMALSSDLISGSFTTLFGTAEPYRVIKDIYSTGVIPIAQSILGLFMLLQLIKISQRIDSTATLPALKEIVFLVVICCILGWFINHAFDVMTDIYGLANDLVVDVADKAQSSDALKSSIEFTSDEASQATFGGCFILLLLGVLSVLIGLAAYLFAIVIALARAIQLYVYAAFSPIPISLLGFDETKQMGIGFLKNFAAAALAGVVMMLILYLYPHIVSSIVVDSGGLQKAELLSIATNGGSIEMVDMACAVIKWLACSFLLILGLKNSGSWAKEILGA